MDRTSDRLRRRWRVDLRWGLAGACLLATGAGISVRKPLLPLFMATELGLSGAQIGWLTAAMTTASVGVGLGIGVASDRGLGRRKLVAASAAVALIAHAALLWVSSVGELLVLACLGLSMSAVPGAQALASTREALEADNSIRVEEPMARLRSVFSAGFLLGPVLAAILVEHHGLRIAMASAAIFYLVCLLVVRGLPEASAESVSRGAEGATTSMRQLFVFGLGTLCLAAADAVRMAFLPLLAVDEAGFEPASAPLLFAAASVLNLLLMPVAGRLADRHGPERVLWSGALVGVVWPLAMAVSTTQVGMFAAQVPYAWFSSCFFAVGLGVSHRIHGRRSGSAVSSFQALTAAGSALGTVVAGHLIDVVGLTSVFMWLATLPALGVLAFAALAGSARRPQPSASNEPNPRIG